MYSYDFCGVEFMKQEALLLNSYHRYLKKCFKAFLELFFFFKWQRLLTFCPHFTFFTAITLAGVPKLRECEPLIEVSLRYLVKMVVCR